MPTLYMIRHGQASFGSDNYDRLSPLGHRQCRLAGEYLRRIGVKFDAYYRGRLARQKSSADSLCSGLYGEEAGRPDFIEEAGFDEYNADALFDAYLPRALAEDETLAAQQARLFSDRALFQQAFAHVMRFWLSGAAHEREHLESWQAFLDRVEQGLARIVAEQERTATVAAITSGGPVSVAVRAALGLADDQTVRLNYGIYNASITRLRVGRSSRRLMGFNDIAHLELAREPELVSFR